MRIVDCGMRIRKNTIPKSEIPNPKFGWPMLAAQSAFPSGPLRGFQKILDQLISHGRLATRER
jgi:hypothetical protein